MIGILGEKDVIINYVQKSLDMIKREELLNFTLL